MMGMSFTLIQKEFLVLSVEIDRSIHIELSTVFTGKVEAITGTAIRVSIKELGDIIKELQEIHTKLLSSKTCPDCLTINAPEAEECDTCSEPLIA